MYPTGKPKLAPSPSRVSLARSTRFEQERELRLKAEALAAVAHERAAKEKVRTEAFRWATRNGVIEEVSQVRVANRVLNERARCIAAGEIFDYALACATAVHEVKTAKGQPSLAPEAPRGAPPPVDPQDYRSQGAVERDKHAQLVAELERQGLSRALHGIASGITGDNRFNR